MNCAVGAPDLPQGFRPLPATAGGAGRAGPRRRAAARRSRARAWGVEKVTAEESGGPTALLIPAWGNAPGFRRPTASGLKARLIEWGAAWMNRAFSPASSGWGFPGALPQAGMSCAFGAQTVRDFRPLLATVGGAGRAGPRCRAAARRSRDLSGSRAKSGKAENSLKYFSRCCRGGGVHRLPSFRGLQCGPVFGRMW